MPIRLCQKCGLKVLIDESQAGTNPFYCQRCTTAMKGQENASAVGPAIKNPTPSPVVSMANRSDPAAPSVGAAKSATVRVLCPYCKASFNGRVPQKPARGSCPVCQKELILLPNGDIKPAAGFDLGSYQGEGSPSKSPEPSSIPESEPAPMPKESGTRLLVKKYAAESQPARPAAKKPDPLATPTPVTAPAETDTADDTNPLPGWLDDSAGAGDLSSPMVKAQPETDVEIDVVAPQKEEPPPVEEEPPPPPPPPPARARAPIAAKMPSLSPGRPPAAVELPPEDPPEQVDLLPPDPPPRKQPSGRIAQQAPAKAPVAVASDGEETGGGKVFLALFLAILPILAGAGMISSKDKLAGNDLVKKIGTRLTVGFGKLHLKLFPPPPPPPAPKVEEKKTEPEPVKEAPPKPDANQKKKDGAAISSLYTTILREQRDLRQSSVAASPEQKAQLEKVKADIEAKQAKLKSMRDMYQKMYGMDYDPANPPND